MKKIIILGVVFLFVGMNFTSSSGVQINYQIIKSFDKGDILYVGGSGEGNYTKIQDAVDNASDGDTVFVYDDSSPYLERILINKSINLIGEDRNTTIINDSRDYLVIGIRGNDINISGFSIQNDGIPHFTRIGVIIYGPSSNIKIYNNIISKNNVGIKFDEEYGAVKTRIFDNIIVENGEYGIKEVTWRKNSVIIIYHNIISNNENGIKIVQSLIYGNHISNNSKGIYLSGIGSIIHHNNIILNDVGLLIVNNLGSYIYKNNFINNKRQTFLLRAAPLSYTLLLTLFKQKWSNNYWGEPNPSPKPILGIGFLFIIVTVWRVDLPFPVAIFPYCEFDWRPAQEPNDINVTSNYEIDVPLSNKNIPLFREFSMFQRLMESYPLFQKLIQ